MTGHFLIRKRKTNVEGNIYADKSSIVLDWLLRIGIDKEAFSIREAAKECSVSLGLVQKVFGQLVSKGLLHSEGIRTNKRFSLRHPQALLNSWINEYSLVKKCKLLNFQSGLDGKEALLKVLHTSKFNNKVALALHSAAEEFGCKNTNLNTLELYLLDPSIKSKLENLLHLEPQERGYEVLLIEPFYKSLLSQCGVTCGKNRVASPLLTFLDLYHFPLRGQEQAEFMAERIPELKRIYKKN
ncbi:MAG: hypothetical protein K1000chlam2_01860 [Chlamydiae bacterium]|nr:hypothetical protein [Chlamydiota bacterium]